MLLRKFSLIFACVYLKILYVSCDEGSSLAFAIDDTRSMWDDIDQVKKEAKEIMNVVLTAKSSEIKDFVLVTINDPDVILRTKTNSSSTFQNNLNEIRVHNYNNQDCEEMSLTGIEKALINSRPGSYIYVFTDAAAKDYRKVDTIKSLCEKKQSQVVFVLTGDCGSLSDKMYTVYHEIATASAGQVFRVRKDQVHTVLETIKVMVSGKHSPVKWLILPRARKSVPVEFTIDEKADYAVVSTSGKSVELQITTTNNVNGPKPDTERIMWNDNGKVLKVKNLKPGTYYAWVKGESSTSVVIYARTDFTFEHGFSILVPKSIKDTSKQPIAGKDQHLSINITDPEHSVDIKSAQILDMEENVIREMPLRKIGENFYTTDTFVSPTQMFKIKVRGIIKSTGKTISRISKTAIEPPPPPPPVPETIPVVQSDEGNKIIKYGSGITLTCKVSAHPKPTIEWFTSDGTLLPSTSSEIEVPEYISYLKLTNIKKNGKYVCKATNRQGSGKSSTEVSVRPIFNEISTPPATSTAQYGKDVKIQCNIKSYLPIKIKWFHSGRELENTPVHTISADGTELTLKSLMDLELEGKYTCEATLISDPTKKVTHITVVTIAGLARPAIEITNRKIQITKGGKIELNCKTVKGHPKPQVKWMKKNGDRFEVLSRQTSEVLRVPRAYFTDAGQYKCVATNVMGTDSAEFEVTMSSLPEITIPETQRTFPYGSNAEFTCNAESNTSPTIVWMDAKANILQNKVTKTSEYKFKSKLRLENLKKSGVYICKATNNVGSNSEYVNITVPSPITVQEHIDGETGIRYGQEKSLRCNIQSSHKMKILWFKQNSGLKASKTSIISDSKYDVSRDGTQLKIKFMGLDMDGKYTCEASLLSDPNEKVSFSTNVKVIGLLKPDVTTFTTIEHGRNFKAICRVKGVPKPTISWQFKPKGSDKFYAISGSEEELNIAEKKLKHSGVYKCLVRNALGETERDLNLEVRESPVITNDKNIFYGVEGDTVLIVPCNFTGFPDPVIVWRKDGNILNNGVKYGIKKNVLHINNPGIKSDTGKVTCEAKNELGTAKETFETVVTDTFVNDENYYGEKHNINVDEKKTRIIKIACSLVNSETSSVRWYMNGNKRPQTGSTYVIENPSVSDDGNYTCRVNTKEGPKAETYVVDIGSTPSFENETPSPKTIDWHEDEVLDCSEQSKPDAKIEWTHNGKKNASLNNIRRTAVTDWGEYTCKVSNLHGTIWRSFKVISSGCYLRNYMGTENMPLITRIKTPSLPNSISNSDMELKKQHKVKLSCPTTTKSANYFQMLPSQKEVIAECDTEDKFIVDGKTYRYKDLQCNTKVEPSFVKTGERCSGPNTEMMRVGFAVNGFFDAYKVCYDRIKNVPVFASSPITLSKSGNGVELSKFKWSSSLGLGDGKPTGGYTCGTSKICCYEKSQLVNVDELPFGPSQAATFKENINSVAVWNPCAGSGRMSWKTFETELKSMSYMYGTWSSWTGASNYVNKSGGLVPRYVWKVMNYDGESSVMVYVNDESPVNSDIKCTQPCESMMESADKFLYCCTLDEFSKVFGISSDKFTA